MVKLQTWIMSSDLNKTCEVIDFTRKKNSDIENYFPVRLWDADIFKLKIT